MFCLPRDHLRTGEEGNRKRSPGKGVSVSHRLRHENSDRDSPETVALFSGFERNPLFHVPRAAHATMVRLRIVQVTVITQAIPSVSRPHQPGAQKPSGSRNYEKIPKITEMAMV